jgi:hypothetical protein
MNHATATDDRARAHRAIADVWAAFGGNPAIAAAAQVRGRGDALPSAFAVGDLATAAVAAANLATAELWAARRGAAVPAVIVDRVAVAAAFRSEALFRPDGWERPAVWDPMAGDYRSADGWVRLHTNYAHHRRAVVDVLHATDRATVARAVATWQADDLEQAVVDAGGCAAALRTEAAWATHPQGVAVAREPLVATTAVSGSSGVTAWDTVTPNRALSGIRVLDLTRVIAGPVATGFLAAHGAQVVRVDPVDFEEVPALLPLTTAAKLCCRLDLTTIGDRDAFDELVAGADVVVSGLRPGALAGLGYDDDALRDRNPDLVIVAHDAYGWTGPWAGRRGFDSLVQLSTGIAARSRLDDGPPVPLPAQALDHATGYLIAAAVARALTERLGGAGVCTRHLSLARTAHLLTELSGPDRTVAGEALTDQEVNGALEAVTTTWGSAHRVRWPGAIAGTAPTSGRPAGPLGSADARWPERERPSELLRADQ